MRKNTLIQVGIRLSLAGYTALLFCSCNTADADTAGDPKDIIILLDSFNRAAGAAHFDEYFAFYTDDAVFAGTDATERWDKKAFMAWAKPIFEKGSAWNFKALERHIYFDQSGKFAWFDELLNTQMEICRGSGVLVRQDNDWKLKQYILSTTVPNEILDSVVKQKEPIEDLLIGKFSK